ncbi:MAG: protease modulator HflC [Planctomycetota bacterium]
MKSRTMIIAASAAVVVLIAAIVIGSGTFVLDETEQAVILQFGDPVRAVTEAGLHWKTPFVQEARRFEKRLLAWDGSPNQIPTRGREFISIDTTARWRIVDPLKFLQSVGSETGAQTRLDDIIDSVVRDKISGSDLVEIVRSGDWEVTAEQLEKVEVPVSEEEGELTREVKKGRKRLIREILREARQRMPQYGIGLTDVRIKRLNYIADVREQVFNRMISERQRIAEQFRSEGQGEASQIEGETSRQLATIRSEAKRKAEVVRGEADAEATRIYNGAYGSEPEFYRFHRTLESYSKTLNDQTVLVIGTDSDYFRYLKKIGGAGQPPAGQQAAVQQDEQSAGDQQTAAGQDDRSADQEQTVSE